jgi:hypothetical protein
VVSYLLHNDLPVDACIGQNLRTPVERYLYASITAPNNSWDGWSRPDVWSLYHSLSDRPDLAQQVQWLNWATATYKVEPRLPASTIYPADVPWTLIVDIDLSEAAITGAMLRLLIEVTDLHIPILESHPWRYERQRLGHQCITALFPGLDVTSAHLEPLGGLQRVENLTYSLD